MTSRVDLLEWLNNLLQINYTKIEQCGTGAAYCQILDSIYGDLPLNKVNWKAQHEYQYINNFKVLQSAFTAKKIDKPIPIERLVKCRMQDNLEFLQWMKRFWDQNYRGVGGYDALTRRSGSVITMGGTPNLPSTSSTSSYPSSYSSSSNSKGFGLAFGSGHGTWSSAGSVTGSETSRGSGSRSGSRREGRGALSPFSAVSTGTSTTVSTRPSSRASSRPGNKTQTQGSGSGSGSGMEAKKVKELQSHLEELTHAVDSLTKERDFYWKKLREVEDLVGEVIEVKASAGEREGLEELERIREVLYREEGDVE